jgi:glycosyl transferase family 25
MSHNFDKIFFINLDKRTDRLEEITAELQQYNLYDNSERFQAIHVPEQGILGCTMSHLAVIKIAKERKYKQILILEDDFYFVVSKEELENQLNTFFDSNISYNVCMIAYNLNKSEPTEYPFIQKVIDAQSASGYIVHESFYDAIINLYEEGIPLLRDTNHHWLYANDQIWKRLQPNCDWFMFTTRIGKQRAGYSDNSYKYQTYEC